MGRVRPNSVVRICTHSFHWLSHQARLIDNEAILQLVQLGWIISDGARSHDTYLNEEGLCQEAQSEGETLAQAARASPQKKQRYINGCRTKGSLCLPWMSSIHGSCCLVLEKWISNVISPPESNSARTNKGGGDLHKTPRAAFTQWESQLLANHIPRLRKP